MDGGGREEVGDRIWYGVCRERVGEWVVGSVVGFLMGFITYFDTCFMCYVMGFIM